MSKYQSATQHTSMRLDKTEKEMKLMHRISNANKQHYPWQNVWLLQT